MSAPVSTYSVWLVVTSVCLAGSLHAQSGRFEVASIRPAGANGGRPSFEATPGGGIHAGNVTLKLLIEMAYEIRPEQVSGGPAWTDSEEYTVDAKGPSEDPALPEAARLALARKRLQSLLAERFQLALKVETNPAAGYSLTVGKQGHKLTPSADPGTRLLRQVGRWELRAQSIEMSTLARFLGVHLRETVVDRTGLEGRYDFHLNWQPAVPVPSALDAAAMGLPEESLLPAVEQQLGLKLERQKVATDRYTIQRVERPTAN